MEKVNYIIFIALGLFPFLLKAQVSLIGNVKDIDTREVLHCAEVFLYSGNKNSYETRTCIDGSFSFTDLEQDTDYCLEIYYKNYRMYEKCWVDIDTESEELEILMYSYNSPSYKISDIANQDIADFGFAFLYNFDLSQNSEFIYGVTWQIYSFDLRLKLANKLQFGFKYIPIELSWINLSNNDQTVFKEQYMGASTKFGIYLRTIVTTHKLNGSRGLFIDGGVSYNLPYYYAHSVFIDKYNKSSVSRNIHKFNEFKAFARIGFGWGAVIAEYRFTDILKTNYLQPPEMRIGIELLFPLAD